MQYRKIISILLILVLVAPWLAPAGKVSATSPMTTPGNGGDITVTSLSQDSVNITWSEAETNTESLSYAIFLSSQEDLNNVQEMNNAMNKRVGTWLDSSSSIDGIFSITASNLHENETYYVNVLVQPSTGPEVAYVMKSFKFISPLTELNSVIAVNFDQAKVMELLGNPNLNDMTPEFTSLSVGQQEELAGIMGNLDLIGGAFFSENQVKNMAELAYQGLMVMQEYQVSQIQSQLTMYYVKFSNVLNFIDPNYRMMIEDNLIKYLNGSDIDQNLFAFIMNLDRISKDNMPVQAVLKLPEMLSYNPRFTKASTSADMAAALEKLYDVQQKAEQYKGTPKEFPIGKFPLDLSKMDDIISDASEMGKLSDWMLLKKPGNGYTQYSEIQEKFDGFFTNNSPLSKLNKAVEDRDLDEILNVLENSDLLIDSSTVTDLTDDDKKSLARALTKLMPSSGSYNKEQIQFIVNTSWTGLKAYHEMTIKSMMTRMSEFYNQVLNGASLFAPEDFSRFSSSAEFYGNASSIDQYAAAYLLKLMYKSPEEKLKDRSVLNLLSVSKERVFINQAVNTNDLFKVFDTLRKLQVASEAYVPSNPNDMMEPFFLQLNKLDELNTEVDRTAFAQWMISKRPMDGGYKSFIEVQMDFNKFFNPDTNTPVTITQVNEARLNQDAVTMRQLIENPALGIHLPTEYETLTSEVKDYIASFLFNNIKKDYENKAQVQYMIELAIQIQTIWEEKDLSLLEEKLDYFAEKLMDSPTYFQDKETEQLVTLGQLHSHRSNIDKSVFALKYMSLLAHERTSGESAGKVANERFVLMLLATPFNSFENIESVDEMDQWLNATMLDQQASKAYLNQLDYNLEGSLDLSKRAELDAKGQKELAEWMLTEESQYESANQFRYVFSRFFTAPKVTVDDIKNSIIGLDETMEISFNNGQNWLDVASMQKIELSGDKTVLVRYKAISDEMPGRAVKMVFTANGDSGNGNGSTPNPGNNTGGNGGGGSSAPVTSTPVTNVPTTKQEQLVVDVNGVNGTNLTKTPITRTTETNGTVKDLVKMTDAIAKESVEKAKQLGTDTARIVIPDTKDAVSETRVEVPKTAIKNLSEGSMKLEISTENAVISIPTKSITGFDQDLYFRVVPLKKESERKDLEERAKKEQVIQQVAPNTNVRVLARPVEIETNMQSREVTLTLPLGNSLPTDAAARQQILDNLAVYIEHSDGTKELVQGKLVKLANNSEGIEFTVTKFSTFTLVVVDGLKATQKTNHPYIQGFGADFRPDAFVTRAQMAAMLARNLPDETATATVAGTTFADVAATHWATSEIQQAQAAGIMNGLSGTAFAPEGSITRAQMATIAYRWLQKQQMNAVATTNTTATAPEAASFTDVAADLWAADAIAYVQSTGLMTGYSDGTFKPDSILTRAEAVKVLNVLFKRTPLAGVATPSFGDVPATHWAYADIEAAAQK